MSSDPATTGNDLPQKSDPTVSLLEPLPGFALPHTVLKSIPLPLEFLAAVDDAEKANRVKSFLPKFFNPLFRKQGVVNKLSLQALSKVGESLKQLSDEIGTRDRLIEKLAEHINKQNANNQAHHGRIMEFCQHLEQHLGKVATDAQSTDAHILGATEGMRAEISSLVRAIQIDEGSLLHLQGNAVSMEAKAASAEATQERLKTELARVQAHLAGIAAVTDSLDARLAETGAQVRAATQADLTASQTAQAREQRLASIEAGLAALQQQVANHEPRFAVFEEQFAALQTSFEQHLAAVEVRHQTEMTQIAQSLAGESQARADTAQQAQAAAAALRTDLEQHLAAVETRHRAEIAQVSRSLSGEHQALTDIAQKIQSLEGNFNTDLGELRSELTILRQNHGSFLERWETALKSTSKLIAKRKDGASLAEKAGAQLVRERQREFDAMYLAFEDRFRGSRELIKDRLKVNLEILSRALPVIRSAPGVRWPDRTDAPVYSIVDLGCGRGEWIEVIAQQGQRALGVDLNAYFITDCRERGLAIVESDAVAFLRTLPDNCLALVSGFHIIEHLPLPALLELITETHRVLVKGGTALFETPNCKNLTVGAANFYSDPTHQHPVFPETAQFLLKHAGFTEARIDYRLPIDGSPFDLAKPDQSVLRDLFYSARDYAVIAIK